jgi:uncharacterized protein (DUF1330 family)
MNDVLSTLESRTSVTRRNAMPYDMLIALTVSDHASYSRYREAISPFLARHQAHFRYDFGVSDVLSTEGDGSINRAFVLSFPDRRRKDAFWADPEYLAAKAQLFERCVRTFTLISEYER